MNYQYRFGTTTTQAIKTLYHDGGWTRYYQGLAAALIQGPVSRFGDTAANVGILALLKGNIYLRRLPELVKTVFASLAAAGFRMILTPVDTVKTTLQTQGKDGMRILRARASTKDMISCLSASSKIPLFRSKLMESEHYGTALSQPQQQHS